MVASRELLYGRRNDAHLNAAPPRVDLRVGDDVVLPGVTVHYSLYELPSVVATDLLPKSLHPTAPGVVALTFWRVPASPVGPFVFASVGVACRTAIKPRHFVLASFASTDPGAQMLKQRFGFAPSLASVEQRLYNDAAVSAVSLDGQPVLEISTGLLRNVSGSSAGLKIPPQLNLALVDDEHFLVQSEVSYEFHRTQRGRPRLAITAARTMGLPDQLRLSPIASSVASADLTLHPVRFALDVNEPSEIRPSRRLRSPSAVPSGV